MSKALKTYAAFKEPSPYDRERQKAEQLRRYAELLQEQSLAQDEPYTFQGIRAMPSPAAALGKMLQAYGSKKASEKADEAEARRMGMEQEAAGQIAGRLMGKPIIPEEGLQEFQSAAPAFAQGVQQRIAEEQAQRESGDIQEITRQSQYRYDPEGAMQRAMTPQGMGAVKGNPMLAAALQKSMETPAPEEFGTEPFISAEGEYVLPGKRGSLRRTGIKAPKAEVAEMTPYQREMLRLRERDINLREKITGAGRPMSATAQRELFDADENVIATESGINMLDQAIKLSPVAYEGVGASQRATAATILPDSFEPKGTKETLEFDLLLKQQVLPQLKSIFGSAPTEGERAILLELQGSSSLPRATREAVLKRARQMANQRLQFNKQKAQKLREGSYFTEQPAATIPDGFELE
jgi:hypothetical protein